MKKLKYIKVDLASLFVGLFMMSCTNGLDHQMGQTSVSKWQGNKKSAISITYDDGIITQFTVARPIMNKLNIPATFFILTGKIEGAQKGKFIGRSPSDILKETATSKTNVDNFFERASLMAYTGISEADEYHAEAGSLFESGKVKEAYQIIDDAFEKLRNGSIKNTNKVVYHNNPQDTTSWNELRSYAAEGHEMASHSITHPRMAVLDEDNLLYELEQSQADIRKYLGEKYTFSAECPYGTEDERVMQNAFQVYPALRNRMPENWLEELNRSSDLDPVASNKEYVQWQRGPLSNTGMDLMKSWVDDCLSRDNIWLVLVFHGVDDFGWEPKTAEELEEYFTYLKEREDELWIATFADVTKYIRERENLDIERKVQKDEIILTFSSDLDPQIYDVPLTLKTYIPGNWNSVRVFSKEIEIASDLEINEDDLGSFVVYNMSSKINQIIITEIR